MPTVDEMMERLDAAVVVNWWCKNTADRYHCAGEAERRGAGVACQTCPLRDTLENLVAMRVAMRRMLHKSTTEGEPDGEATV